MKHARMIALRAEKTKVMLRPRKEELVLYGIPSSDPNFKATLYQSIKDFLRSAA